MTIPGILESLVNLYKLVSDTIDLRFSLRIEATAYSADIHAVENLDGIQLRAFTNLIMHFCLYSTNVHALTIKMVSSD